ncbi:hypothetical protein [Paenibacillus aceris]|uniref:DUF4878 domain-containing protein n=1 Tax=Paenibacillus aceris TaxID=869555 RepID=A0ABS4I5A3_9BACL|nr:hypothetical protein [Paenibacillus aceris]MBP1965586.1 hypothetical protein [Paenibacillus aceris]NHW38475.1 hypothetical protein [Paenibacillus aceris]
MIKMKQVAKKIVLIPLLTLFIVGCAKPQKIDSSEYLDIYKDAIQTIFEQEANFYNNSRMSYLLVRTDNLKLKPEEKAELLNYVKQISKVDVGEGKYSDIETNLAKNKFGGMAIELENIIFRTDGKAILTSRKTFLGSIQLRQTIEKKDDIWITSKKDKIVKSK